MNNVSTVIERLKTMPGCPFRLIEAAAGLAEVKERPNALPAAYVYVKGEAADDAPTTGRVLQRVEADIAVLIVTANLRDARGGAASADIETLKGAVRRRLLGFVDPQNAAGEPFTYVEGQAVRLHGGTVWYEETYGVAYYIEEQS